MHICSVLYRPYDIFQPISYRKPKISITYLIFSAELTDGLACYDAIYIVLIFLLLLHSTIKNVDLDLGLDLLVLNLDLKLVDLD